MNHTTKALIHQSSPNIQFQGLSDLNFQEGELRFSAMEDSSNGKEKETPEVVVEDVKHVEIHDEDDGGGDSEPVNKREISIFEQVVHKAEELLDGDDRSSSSSSSSDDEKEAKESEEKSPVVEESSESKDDLKQVVEEEVVIEESSLPCLVENVEEIPQVLEDLVSKIEAVTSLVSGGSEEPELPLSDQKNETNNDNSSALAEPVVDHSKATEMNPGESTEEAAPASEASNQNIPENTTDSPIEPVTRDSLQPTSWRSCCGLFEVLGSSDR